MRQDIFKATLRPLISDTAPYNKNPIKDNVYGKI
jgi:hypothetical protein